MSKILVVDDDQSICRNLKEILTDKGHDVEAVNSGFEALKLLDESDFDVVLLDLVMPGMTGMELLSEIRLKKPNTQVVMITAFATIENAVEAMKRGATDYVSKPFKMNEIEVVVNMALEDAKFKEQFSSKEMSTDIENILNSINNGIRRKVIIYLDKGSYGFTEILRAVGTEDPTKLNFHLRKLKSNNLVDKDANKKYILTQNGKRALEILKQLDNHSSSGE